ncbi:MAG: site-specific integrase [Ruminococcus sp.]|nr:site-specific integrase [Ruminococcus sp.]
MEKKNRYDSNRVRLRTREYERPNGRYEYRYTVFGKHFAIYDKTLEGLREKEEQIRSQETTSKEKFDKRTTTLNDVFELWKELKRGIRPNTYRNYCYMYEQYVKDSIGEMYISAIKKSDIKRFFNYLADERRLKEGTVEAVQTILHQVLQIAVDDDWIEKNPSDQAVKELKRSHQWNTQKRQALTKEQQDLLMSFLSKNTPNRRWYPITAVLLGTGMRVGEATGLLWCDVDFENDTINVDHTLVYYSKGVHNCDFAINDTKTPASKRLIPMTKQVKRAFLMEKKMQEQIGIVCTVEVDGYSNFIFCNRFGGLHHQGSLNKAYKRIIRDCNDAEFLKSENPKVLLPNFSCHNLRHTFATRLCESGMNLKMIQDILGHVDVATTINIYTHVTKEIRNQAKDIMEEYFK